MGKRIIIADDEPITRMDISNMLKASGYDVVAEASDGFDAIELCKRHRPNLLIIDIKMPLLDGLNASKVINEQGLADSILLLTAYSGREFIEQAKQIGVMGYIVKPVNEKSLFPAVEIAISKGQEINTLKNKTTETKNKLDNRKNIERAKGIIMEEYELSEEAAYQKIREISKTKRCSMNDIAKIIILNKANK